jgi:hypothetical protein
VAALVTLVLVKVQAALVAAALVQMDRLLGCQELQIPAAVEEVGKTVLLLVLAAQALSSSRSTNKDLWKLNSTECMGSM